MKHEKISGVPLGAILLLPNDQELLNQLGSKIRKEEAHERALSSENRKPKNIQDPAKIRSIFGTLKSTRKDLFQHMETMMASDDLQGLRLVRYLHSHYKQYVKHKTLIPL